MATTEWGIYTGTPIAVLTFWAAFAVMFNRFTSQYIDLVFLSLLVLIIGTLITYVHAIDNITLKLKMPFDVPRRLVPPIRGITLDPTTPDVVEITTPLFIVMDILLHWLPFVVAYYLCRKQKRWTFKTMLTIGIIAIYFVVADPAKLYNIASSVLWIGAVATFALYAVI